MIVGDLVTVVDEKPLFGNIIAPPLKIGEKKQILKVYKCKCGQEHFDVGLVSKYNYISCYTCKQELPNGDTIHWCHPSRFL